MVKNKGGEILLVHPISGGGIVLHQMSPRGQTPKRAVRTAPSRKKPTLELLKTPAFWLGAFRISLVPVLALGFHGD